MDREKAEAARFGRGGAANPTIDADANDHQHPNGARPSRPQFAENLRVPSITKVARKIHASSNLSSDQMLHPAPAASPPAGAKTKNLG